MQKLKHTRIKPKEQPTKWYFRKIFYKKYSNEQPNKKIRFRQKSNQVGYNKGYTIQYKAKLRTKKNAKITLTTIKTKQYKGKWYSSKGYIKDLTIIEWKRENYLRVDFFESVLVAFKARLKPAAVLNSGWKIWADKKHIGAGEQRE